MDIDGIKAAIKALPDKKIEPLVKWLKEYYDGEVWDRQMEADIARVGPDAWEAALQQDTAQSDESHKAALRLMNNMQFRSDADREQALKDFSLLVGKALDAGSGSVTTAAQRPPDVNPKRQD